MVNRTQKYSGFNLQIYQIQQNYRLIASDLVFDQIGSVLRKDVHTLMYDMMMYSKLGVFGRYIVRPPTRFCSVSFKSMFIVDFAF